MYYSRERGFRCRYFLLVLMAVGEGQSKVEMFVGMGFCGSRERRAIISMLANKLDASGSW